MQKSPYLCSVILITLLNQHCLCNSSKLDCTRLTLTLYPDINNKFDEKKRNEETIYYNRYSTFEFRSS